MTQRFDKKVLIVTGGNQGIGRAASVAAAHLGASVVVASRTEKTGIETVGIIEKSKGRAIYVQTDVSDEASVIDMVKKTLESFGSIDMAFNNAGGGATSANPVSTLEQSVEDWDTTINNNLKGTWLCMKHEIPAMLETGQGSIVNMSSIAGVRPVPVGGPSYTAAKSGIAGLTGMTGLEFAGRGIRINAVAPTVTLTERWHRDLEDKPELKNVISEIMPMSRPGNVEEVVNAVLWLLSESSSYVTGQTLSVDGAHSDSIGGYQSPRR